MRTKKKYVWNADTCSCENRKYVWSIIDNPAIKYDEVIEETQTVPTKTSPTNITTTISIF